MATLELRKLRVRSLDIDFNEVSWELVDTSEDVLDFTFQILRSESPSGPFEPLAPPFTDKYIFVDNTLTTGHRWRKYFYQLAVAHVPSGGIQHFGPEARDPDPDLIALELRRHMQLLFREFSGRRCWVLPARTFGQRCSCWNAKLRQRTRSGCITCFDTSFVRGYLHPIESWVQMDPSPKTVQHTNGGSQQQSNTTCRLAWYPPVKPDDLVIEPENRRWRVVSVTQTEQGRAAVHQEVQLHEIPPKDIEFAVPLNMQEALRDLWLNPARNYTNPQSLQAFLEREAPNIFSLYQKT
jgi:hypothetical protein